MLAALRRHGTEYAAEALGLGIFMLSACGFAALLYHPASPVARDIPHPLARNALMGVAMGLTNIVNIYSPWGRRSGSHLNPAVTLTFTRLGKLPGADAAGYIGAQFLGGALGTGLAVLLLRDLVRDPSVFYVVTRPGPWGIGAAFAAEALISGLLMLVVLIMSNSRRFAGLTGVAAGLLVALYIAIEVPVSGMSMNPARTLGSAVWAGSYMALWLYFVAPPLGMLAAAEAYLRFRNYRPVFCAKLHHDSRYRCIFCEAAARRAGGRADGRTAGNVPATARADVPAQDAARAIG
jgi:aquaporin Z